MANIIINEAKHTIEITKTFAKDANKYGSAEYFELRDARHDFPNYKVVTKVTKSNSSIAKHLTFKDMKDYIAKHDTDGTIMAEFNDLRANNAEAKEAFADSLNYGEIKAWFLNRFPEIEAFHETRNARMEAVKKARAEKRVA